MERKQATYKIKGMAQDYAPSMHNPEFSFENKNIRIVSRENNTFLSIENEKGTSLIPLQDPITTNTVSMRGTCLGQANINEGALLFIHNHYVTTNKDSIIFIKEINSTWTADVLFNGNLNFSLTSPIQTLVSYENEQIQKVYWVDKTNPPRLINIKESKSNFINENYFNFIPTLKLQENIKVYKNDVSDGVFPSGVVQYAFSYFNKFGPESNIFYTSPLYYTSNKNRGGAPDEIVSSTFTLTLNNVDTSFEYVRIYSIVRSSENTTPIVKIVADLKTSQLTEIVTTKDTVNKTYPGTKDLITDTSYTRNPITNVQSVYPSNTTTGPQIITPIPNENYILDNIMFAKKDSIGNIQYLVYDNLLGGFKEVIYDGEGVPISYGTSIIYFGANSSLLVFSNTFSINQVPVDFNVSDSVGFELHIKSTYPGSSIPIIYTNNTIELNIPDAYIEIYEVSEGLTVTTEYIGVEYQINSINLAATDFYKQTGNILNKLTTLSSITLNKDESLVIIGNINLNILDNNTTLIYTVVDSSARITITNTSDSTLSLLLSSYLSIDSLTTDSTFKYESLLIENVLSYTDNNTTGEITTSTRLLYVGGEDIIAQSLSQKDNVLFLGNITLRKKIISDQELTNYSLEFIQKELYTEKSQDTVYGYIPETLNNKEYNNSINTANYNSQKSFKWGETYRFGIQAQHKTGRWSDVLFVEDKANTIQPSVSKVGNSVIVKGAKATLTITDTNLLNTLYNNGYIKLRGVVVYPDNNNKTILAQGIVNSTVMHVGDKYSNISDNYSSWFFRPIRNSTALNTDPTSGINRWPEFRHNQVIPGFDKTNGEIQTNYGYPVNPYINSANESLATGFSTNYNNNFYIDESVVTFHSPDLEFDEQIQQIDGENLKFRIIGFAALTAYKSNLDITTSSAPFDVNGGSKLPNVGMFNYSNAAFNLLQSPAWYDRIVKAENNDWSQDRTLINYIIYPWHANRSLNNQPNVADRTALLETKTLDTIRYAGYNEYFSTANIWNPPYGITTVGVYNKDSENLVKISSPIEENSNFVYNGILDKLISANYKSGSTYDNFPYQFPIMVEYNGEIKTLSRDMAIDGSYETAELPQDYRLGTELIRMNFKSTTHAVFGFNWGGNIDQVVLPSITAGTTITDSTKINFWKLSTTTVRQDIKTITSLTNGGFWIGELYRDNINNRFGGQYQGAYENNTWLPCGEPVSIVDANDDVLTSVVINYTEGDTFLQRYDCLKTYPVSLDSQNGIVDIASFIVETHINLDGRYDRNRGLINNSIITPSNYNLINDVYNQKNNYFTYHALDQERFALNRFPNTLTWTTTKLAGSLIDSWTNITMVNTYDVNGELGPIRSINLFNNQLFGFQDRGLFNVLYNSRVQLNTSDGMPIELANSGVVDGIRYISNSIGAKNPRSVKVTPSGIYFVDDEAKTMNLFNGEVNVLSDNLGFRTWMNTNHTFVENDDASNMQNFSIYYDKLNKDVYLVNKFYALQYSEILRNFVSFFSYNNAQNIFNIGDSLFSFAIDNSNPGDEYTRLWEHRTGDYNVFYGKEQNFYIKYLFNPDPQFTKIFDSLDIRADVFNTDGAIQPGVVPFSEITVENDYQEVTRQLNNNNIKAKFRVWRTWVPRSNSATNSILPSNPNAIEGQDRIRNPWAFFTLTKYGIDNDRVILYDTTIHYTL